MVDDTVFVAASSTQGGTVTVKSGDQAVFTQDVGPGVQMVRVPMGVGAQSFEFSTKAGLQASGKSDVDISDSCWVSIGVSPSVRALTAERDLQLQLPLGYGRVGWLIIRYGRPAGVAATVPMNFYHVSSLSLPTLPGIFSLPTTSGPFDASAPRLDGVGSRLVSLHGQIWYLFQFRISVLRAQCMAARFFPRDASPAGAAEKLVRVYDMDVV